MEEPAKSEHEYVQTVATARILGVVRLVQTTISSVRLVHLGIAIVRCAAIHFTNAGG